MTPSQASANRPAASLAVKSEEPGDTGEHDDAGTERLQQPKEGQPGEPKAPHDVTEEAAAPAAAPPPAPPAAPAAAPKQTERLAHKEEEQQAEASEGAQEHPWQEVWEQGQQERRAKREKEEAEQAAEPKRPKVEQSPTEVSWPATHCPGRARTLGPRLWCVQRMVH